jgi:hypothetical protein
MRAQLERWDYRNQHVVVIGHSHGGWTAGKLIEALAVAGETEPVVDLLVTLDPISYAACQAEQIRAALGIAHVGGISLGPCTRAPADLHAPVIARLSERWLNYYQDQCAYLHSGPMPSASNTAVHVDVPRGRDLTYLRELLQSQIPEIVDAYGDSVMTATREYLERRPDMNPYFHIDLATTVEPRMAREIDAGVLADVSFEP